MENKIDIDTKDMDGNDIKLTIINPTSKILTDAQFEYNLKLSSLIKKSLNTDERLLSKEELDQHLEKIGVWTKKEQTEFLSLQLEIRDLELKLKKGGIKKSEGRDIALKMSKKRNHLFLLYSKRSQYEQLTMENFAEQHKLSFIAFKCILDSKTNKPYFKSFEDYRNRQNEQAAIDGAKALSKILYGYDENFDKNLPEKQWLYKYGFINDKGQLINKDGKVVNESGRLINEEGRLVNENGDYIDINGNIVDKKGEFIIETEPFIDDETGEKILK